MKKELFKPALIVIFLGMFISAAESQNKDYDTKAFHKYAKHFDASNIVTLKGEVDAVYKTKNDKAIGSKVQVDFTTDDETIRIHIGPSWFIEDKGFDFTKGDKLTVTGSRVTINDNEVIIATEIYKDGKEIKLRDLNGTPLWIGWGEK